MGQDCSLIWRSYQLEVVSQFLVITIIYEIKFLITWLRPVAFRRFAANEFPETNYRRQWLRNMDHCHPATPP
ncbi:hypothetical protein GOBAR_AA04767 [Gossypium barbadense]|uniref:Uncharacterized protein n=1 Tax=Gossypium barbadense TaxID=3634 RepID=A0A2P5YJM4_GOSBA|nr:hypothetical protein GOBAR_AA04767 [Gossypium barbadense]